MCQGGERRGEFQRGRSELGCTRRRAKPRAPGAGGTSRLAVAERPRAREEDAGHRL